MLINSFSNTYFTLKMNELLWSLLIRMSEIYTGGIWIHKVGDFQYLFIIKKIISNLINRIK